MNIRFAIVGAVTSWLCAAAMFAGDWITAPSYFTHDPTGQRVQQYTAVGPFYVYAPPDFQRSGYRHTRSSIQAGQSIDHYNLVEEWGRPVRPYDEWRFPNRPYSAPYDMWGPPYAGLGNAFGGFPVFPWAQQPFNGFGYGGRWPPPGQPPIVPYRGYQPWFDDRYPSFDDRAPWRNPAFPQQPVPPIP